MLNKKNLVIILLVVVLGAAIAVYFIFFKVTKVVVENQPAGFNQTGTAAQLPGGDGSQVGENSGGRDNTQVVLKSKLSQSEVDAVAVARFFIEMLGTYSPEAKFQNIIDLQPMMTESMRAWSQDLIKRNMGGQLSEAITTRVAKIEVVASNETETKISAITRRTSLMADEEKNYNQEVEVNLVKEANGWKVSRLTWK